MNNKVKTILAILIVSLVVAGVAYAINYVLQTSNIEGVDVTSGTVYVPVTLAVNATAISDLDTLELTASTGINGAGKTVTFYDGVAPIGTGVLADVGGGVYAAVLLKTGLTVGHHDFTAGQ